MIAANEETGELGRMRLLDLAETEGNLVRLLERYAEEAQDPEADPEALVAVTIALETALAAVQGDEAAKVDALGDVLDELAAQEAAAEAFRKAADGIRARHMRRRDALNNRAKWLKEYLGLCMDTAGVKSIKGRKHSARWQGQVRSVSVVEGAEERLARMGLGYILFTVRVPAWHANDMAEHLMMLASRDCDEGFPVTGWWSAGEVDKDAVRALLKAVPQQVAELERDVAAERAKGEGADEERLQQAEEDLGLLRTGLPVALLGLVELGPDRHIRVS